MVAVRRASYSIAISPTTWCANLPSNCNECTDEEDGWEYVYMPNRNECTGEEDGWEHVYKPNSCRDNAVDGSNISMKRIIIQLDIRGASPGSGGEIVKCPTGNQDTLWQSTQRPHTTQRTFVARCGKTQTLVSTCRGTCSERVG